MSMSFKASPDGTYGEILVNGQVVAKLPVTGNAVIPGLVGTVSQSGGTPTGAVVERGSNVNGEYVRFADGTQICWIEGNITLAINIAYGSLFQNTHSWSFPATFSAAPAVSGMLKWGSSASWSSIGSAPSTSTTLLRAIDTVSRDTSQATYRAYTAIGRWF